MFCEVIAAIAFSFETAKLCGYGSLKFREGGDTHNIYPDRHLPLNKVCFERIFPYEETDFHTFP